MAIRSRPPHRPAASPRSKGTENTFFFDEDKQEFVSITSTDLENPELSFCEVSRCELLDANHPEWGWKYQLTKEGDDEWIWKGPFWGETFKWGWISANGWDCLPPLFCDDFSSLRIHLVRQDASGNTPVEDFTAPGNLLYWPRASFGYLYFLCPDEEGWRMDRRSLEAEPHHLWFPSKPKELNCYLDFFFARFQRGEVYFATSQEGESPCSGNYGDGVLHMFQGLEEWYYPMEHFDLYSLYDAIQNKGKHKERLVYLTEGGAGTYYADRRDGWWAVMCWRNNYPEDTSPYAYTKLPEYIPNPENLPLFLLDRFGKKGIWSYYGDKFIVPFEYEEIEFFDGGEHDRYFVVRRMSDVGRISLDGKWIEPLHREE